MIFDFTFALQIVPVLAKAALTTIFATVAGFALALIIGLAAALACRYGARQIAIAVRFVMEFIRSTPLLVQIFFIFFLGPRIGITLPPLTAGILALGLHYGAYLAEVYRSGFEAVPKGQWEAANALGLGLWQTLRLVILRQAIQPIVPALGNYFIAMFKETPLLSAIAVIELMASAKLIAAETFRYIEPVTLVGIFFLLMSAAGAMLTRYAEQRLQIPR
jgi:polar amino acid transport system permease protein